MAKADHPTSPGTSKSAITTPATMRRYTSSGTKSSKPAAQSVKKSTGTVKKSGTKTAGKAVKNTVPPSSVMLKMAKKATAGKGKKATKSKASGDSGKVLVAVNYQVGARAGTLEETKYIAKWPGA